MLQLQHLASVSYDVHALGTLLVSLLYALDTDIALVARV